MNRAVEDALKVTEAMVEAAAMVVANFGCESESPTPVSYTHLTLPTIHVECRSRWSPDH